jgi:GntR family transcriptional regulator, transcriptional repressor for pyruvate dehydrogenase complex
MIFRVASQNRVFQDVVNQIQEAILNGKLSTGDVLPPERDLKAMFNTSRGTLREALRVLEERGLIEIKLGVHGGAIVRGVNADQMTGTLARMIQSQQVDLNHLAEFREGVEGNVASLAAQRAVPEEIQMLRQLVEAADGYVFAETPDRDAFIEVDKQFHQELARISGNPVYIFVLETIHENIHRYYDRYLSMERHELEENFRDLRDIADAIAEHKADEARVLAQSHVLRFNRRMARIQSRQAAVQASVSQTTQPS